MYMSRAEAHRIRRTVFLFTMVGNVFAVYAVYECYAMMFIFVLGF